MDGLFYIGSADWMHRNLEARVEAVTPIETRSPRQELWTILRTHLNDQRSAWDMRTDGTYIQRRPQRPSASAGSHQQLMERARRRR